MIFDIWSQLLPHILNTYSIHIQNSIELNCVWIQINKFVLTQATPTTTPDNINVNINSLYASLYYYSIFNAYLWRFLFCFVLFCKIIIIIMMIWSVYLLFSYTQIISYDINCSFVYDIIYYLCLYISQFKL